MSDEIFGGEQEDPTKQPIKLAVPVRPLNVIEHELRAQMYEELITTADVPVPFVEDGDLANGSDYIPIFGRPLSLDEAITAGGIVAEPIEEKYRRQIVVARELGPKATLAEYFAACALENINPILTEQIK